jgi:hypothetical protein
MLTDAPKGYRKAEHRPKRITIRVYMTRQRNPLSTLDGRGGGFEIGQMVITGSRSCHTPVYRTHRSA